MSGSKISVVKKLIDSGNNNFFDFSKLLPPPPPPPLALTPLQPNSIAKEPLSQVIVPGCFACGKCYVCKMVYISHLVIVLQATTLPKYSVY